MNTTTDRPSTLDRFDLEADPPEEELAGFVESALRFSPVLDLFRNGCEVALRPRAGRRTGQG
jgi:hypothetical protein